MTGEIWAKDSSGRGVAVYAFIARRILLSGLSVFVISMLSYAVIELPPGDAIDNYIHELEEGDSQMKEVTRVGNDRMRKQHADALRAFYGMDKPIYVRYGKWVWNMAHGEFGHTLMRANMGGSGLNKVTDIIQDRLLFTMILTASTTVFIFIVSFPIGIYSAVRQHSVEDYAATTIGFLGLAIPDFLLSLVLAFMMFHYFDQSVGGLFSGDMQYQPWSVAKFWDLRKHLALPVIVLGTAGTAGTIRVLRNNLLDEMRKPYVVTARSKGLVGWKIVLKYPVRIAMNPVISNIGSILPGLIGGSIIVSVILDLPTVGPVLLDSIMTQEVNVAGFIVLMLGLLTVIGVLISDIMLVIVDPRIRMWD